MARIARLNSSENSRQLKICSNKAKAHNEGKTPILINTDQLVAFNVICHDIVLMKMRKMNFGEESLKLLENYLKGKTNRTIVGGHVSSPLDIDDIVPEGSILGPLLYWTDRCWNGN